MSYSLHTEYSYGTRSFSSNIINKLPTLKSSHKKYVPQLWFNKKWAEEFSEFIKFIVENNQLPTIIEIHPPFKDYCSEIDKFIEIYEVFEKRIIQYFSDTIILIENRCGSIYPRSNFLISKAKDILEISNIIDEKGLKLNIVLDINQLFTSHFKSSIPNETDIKALLQPLIGCRKNIKCLHLWGKKKSETGRIVSHVGDLNTYFNDNQSLKSFFLNEIFNLFSDEHPRYFVPEVNSNDSDLASIVQDLLSVGFKFN